MLDQYRGPGFAANELPLWTLYQDLWNWPVCQGGVWGKGKTEGPDPEKEYMWGGSSAPKGAEAGLLPAFQHLVQRGLR